MINWIKSKIKRFRFVYDALIGVNQGQLRITKKGKVKKQK